MTEEKFYAFMYKTFTILWIIFFLMAIADIFWIFSIIACFACLILRFSFVALERNSISIPFIKRFLAKHEKP